MTEDPLVYLDGYNLYQYARNNPLKYYDPLWTTAKNTANSGTKAYGTGGYTDYPRYSIWPRKSSLFPSSAQTKQTYTPKPSVGNIYATEGRGWKGIGNGKILQITDRGTSGATIC